MIRLLVSLLYNAKGATDLLVSNERKCADEQESVRKDLGRLRRRIRKVCGGFIGIELKGKQSTGRKWEVSLSLMY